ncbi:glycosyltransferase [Kineococcus sp. G2]|uniref:glycosyltransferase n=1 Tax=Kineococcus sp. G2 TaxID=3127484 RepID=UPI00301DCACD
MSGRLVVMTRGLPHHHVGGMESVAWDLSRALATGSAVTVLTTALPARASAPGHTFAQDGVDVRALPGTAPGRYSRAWWGASRRALAELLDEGPVAGVLSVSAAAFGCLDLPAAAGTRLVLQAHGTSLTELRSKLERRSLRSTASTARNAVGLVRDLRSYRRFDAVVAVGPSVAESFTSFPLSRFGRVPRLLTIANGVDTSVFHRDDRAAARVRRRLGVPASARVLLVAGRLHEQKRVDRVLRCLHELAGARPDLDPHLVIAGEGPEERRLRGLAAALDLSPRVRFTGALEREDLAAHCSAADLSVLASQRREVGLTMSVLESLACGTPALVPLSTAGTDDAPDAVTRVDTSDARATATAAAAVLDRGHPAGSLLPGRYELRRVAHEYDQLLRGTR